MTGYNTRLLVPTEEEEIYPYRRVWRSFILETASLLAFTMGVWALVGFAGVRVPTLVERPLEYLLALLPFGLWLVFSLAQERSVPEPRQNLLTVVIISALVTNAVSLPLIEHVLQVDRWLPLGNAISRIVGYTFTVGIVQAMSCYMVVRYVAYRSNLRVRIDGVAYMLAAAVGYATVLNLHYVINFDATLPIVAVRVFNNTALLYAIALVIGYGLGEVRFGRPTPLLLTLTLALGATLTGVAIPVRSGLANAALTFAPAIASPIRGLFLSVVLVAAVAFASAFLIENAERQAREAEAARD